jgi:hypothetical protein
MMVPALAAVGLQIVMSVPVSTSMSVATPYERANVAAPSVGGANLASTTVAGAQVSAAAQAEENITIRRGSAISHERAPKGKPAPKQ